MPSPKVELLHPEAPWQTIDSTHSRRNLLLEYTHTARELESFKFTARLALDALSITFQPTQKASQPVLVTDRP
jgi:hypothetical protein